MLNTIIGWLIPALLSGIIGYLVSELKKKKDEMAKEKEEFKNQIEAQKEATVALLRGSIVNNCEQYNKLRFLPDYARYTINELGKNYGALGGNHGIEELITKTNQLPPVKMTNRKVIM